MNYELLKKFFLTNLNINIDSYKNNIKVLKNESIENILPFIGCFKMLKDDIIVDYKLVVPDIKDIKTMLINIHEYTHAIIVNNEIGLKDIETIYEEVIPITMEKFFVLNYTKNYINEFDKIQLTNLKKYMNNPIKYQKYIFGYYYQNEFLEKYKNNMSDLINHKFEGQDYQLII